MGWRHFILSIRSTVPLPRPLDGGGAPSFSPPPAIFAPVHRVQAEREPVPQGSAGHYCGHKPPTPPSVVACGAAHPQRPAATGEAAEVTAWGCSATGATLPPGAPAYGGNLSAPEEETSALAAPRVDPRALGGRALALLCRGGNGHTAGKRPFAMSKRRRETRRPRVARTDCVRWHPRVAAGMQGTGKGTSLHFVRPLCRSPGYQGPDNTASAGTPVISRGRVPRGAPRACLPPRARAARPHSIQARHHAAVGSGWRPMK